MTELAGHGPSSPLVPRGSDYPGEPRAAIVTGASRGIGLAIAEALVKRGDKVCITGRNAEPLAEAVASLGADSAIYVAGKAHDAGAPGRGRGEDPGDVRAHRLPGQQRRYESGVRPDPRPRRGRGAQDSRCESASPPSSGPRRSTAPG